MFMVASHKNGHNSFHVFCPSTHFIFEPRIRISEERTMQLVMHPSSSPWVLRVCPFNWAHVFVLESLRADDIRSTTNLQTHRPSVFRARIASGGQRCHPCRRTGCSLHSRCPVLHQLKYKAWKSAAGQCGMQTLSTGTPHCPAIHLARGCQQLNNAWPGSWPERHAERPVRCRDN